MSGDDLNAPLGRDRRGTRRKLPVAAPQILAAVLGASGIVVVAWAIFADDPLGGEPMAVVATHEPIAKDAATSAEGDGKLHSRHDGLAEKAPPAAAAATDPAAGAKTVTIIDGSSGKRQDVVIPDPGSGGGGKEFKTPADPRLLDTSRHGSIPKIAADGTRAFTLYAQPRQLDPAKAKAPRIALIIGGLGISASGTADAFSKLPGTVTFAFAPYGADLEKLAARARDEGHETMLQAPMEPFDYPDNDPGPQTLLTTLTAEQNIDRLHWQMSRFQGYVGIECYMGARFTASEQALTPVLREVARRGLIYVDDGSSSRSIAGQLAGGHNLPFAKTDVAVDAVPTLVAIDQALARLEMLARERGSAIGVASALPATIARIAEWARKVEGRGILLVPITMVAIKAKSS